jgi:hypothetical protein
MISVVVVPYHPSPSQTHPSRSASRAPSSFSMIHSAPLSPASTVPLVFSSSRPYPKHLKPMVWASRAADRALREAAMASLIVRRLCADIGTVDGALVEPPIVSNWRVRGEATPLLMETISIITYLLDGRWVCEFLNELLTAADARFAVRLRSSSRESEERRGHGRSRVSPLDDALSLPYSYILHSIKRRR